MKSNLILIGMPGSGKSTVGVILAKLLGYSFVDSDLLIQKSEGKLLREIIAEKGIDGFIEVENRINSGIDAGYSVIATGGSAVYGREAMKHLRTIGTVVYLRLSCDQLKQRLGNIKNRGVIIRKGQTLSGLYAERSPLYERYADIIIDEDGCDIEATVEKILENYKSHL